MRGIKITQSITDRQDTSLKLYFRDVSKYPILTPEEEVELVKRIKKDDKEAFDNLVTSNLRFVVSVAKQYQGKGIPLVDLIQEGSKGLIKAVSTFDDTKGFRFFSYAVWWIRQHIIKALSDQCRTVRLPLNQIVNYNKISKSSEKFEQEFGRLPSPEELKELTDLELDDINLTLTSSNKQASLDAPIKNEDSTNLLDICENTNVEPTDNLVNSIDLHNEIENVLQKLPERESDILRLSYGIGVPQMTYEQIANLYGLGYERVRQIKHNAIKLIRKNFIDDLKSVYEN